MENANIDENQKKKLIEEEIIEEIEKNKLIINFNASIKEVFPNLGIEFTNKKIYFCLLLKYINSKKLDDLIKYNPILKDIYRKNEDTIYIYSLFYIYLKFQLFDKDNNDNKKNNKFTGKIISLTKYFKLIRFFYKNLLINCEKVINIFKYIIHQIKKRRK